MASGARPALSFGVPVRNGERHLPRLLASLAAQSFHDFEVVVCDNRSDDRTCDVVASFANRDPRVRLVENADDIGQIGNFNRVLELARGRCFRWIGADDWLEPEYAERCVAALDADSNAIGVTTYQDHVEDDGTRHYAEFTGPRLDSHHPEVRFARMLWFLTADYRYLDPVYTLVRRSVLARTRRLLRVPQMDQVLAAELALAGPFAHVPTCLAHRRKDRLDEEAARAAYDPEHPGALDDARIATRTVPAIWEAIRRANLTRAQLAVCAAALARYGAIRTRRGLEPRARHAARRAVRRLMERGGTT